MPNKEPAVAGKGIYLDNAAAVPCTEKYLQAFAEYSLRYPGNQESLSFHGSRASAAVNEASERILESFKVTGRTHEVFYCNTGTECAAAAVRGLCLAVSRQHCSQGEIVTSALEHPALLQSLKRNCLLFGLKLKICPASRSGILLEDLKKQLTSQTLAVAVHHVESQTGAILDLAGLRQAMNEICPRALLLADSVQSAGKLEIDLQNRNAPDLLFVSGQKLAVPSSGAVICCSGVGKELRSLRQKEHFSGRCTPGAILTLADALTEQIRNQGSTYEYVQGLNRLLHEELKKYSLPLKRTLPEKISSPFIAHYLTMPYQGAILTRSLYKYGISIAPGSACESESASGSSVLTAMGYSAAESYCALRFSFSSANTREEISSCVEKLALCIREY